LQLTAREAKHQYLLMQWANRITERAKSGMTVKGWCEANNVKERSYHYWLKKVREHAAQFLPATKGLELSATLPGTLTETTSVGLVPLPQASPVPNGWAICEPAPPPAEPEQGITIEIGKGRITATAGTDADLLMKVCRVLVEL
jgi:hypothetical protein